MIENPFIEVGLIHSQHFCFDFLLGLTGLEVFVPKGRIFHQETEKLFL